MIFEGQRGFVDSKNSYFCYVKGKQKTPTLDVQNCLAAEESACTTSWAYVIDRGAAGQNL